jgi:hypothetical protein
MSITDSPFKMGIPEARASQIAFCKLINEAVATDPSFKDDDWGRTLAAFPDLADTDRIVLVLTMSTDCDGEKFLCDWVWPIVEQPQWHINYSEGGSEKAGKQDQSEWWFPHLFPEFSVVVGKDKEGTDIEQWMMPLLRGEAAKQYKPIYEARADELGL